MNDARYRHEAITLALQVPHELPSRPFDYARLALWLCRGHVYGVWNDRARTICRVCGSPRATT